MTMAKPSQRDNAPVGATDASGHRRISVLLWAPQGSGEHYNGPGMASYRLYSSARGEGMSISLAHGFRGQEDLSLFERVSLIDAHDGSAVSQVKFLHRARSWIERHAHWFDIFHGVTSFHTCIKPALWAEQRGVPAFVRVARHRSDLADKPGWRAILGLPRRRREIIASLSGVIALSSEIGRELCGYGIPREKIALIPNGVDTSRFAPLRTQREKRVLRMRLGWPNVPTIIFVGGISQRKQPHIVVEAARALYRQGLDFHLVFVGPVKDADYHRKILKLANSSAISERITWIDFTRDVATLYKAADIFALPSRGEGMSNALLEAMASELAVICTPVSGATDAIVAGENGSLVADGVAALSHALEAYLRDEGRRLSHAAAARTRMVETFSSAAVYEAHLRLFKSVPAGKEPASAASLISL